MTHFKPWLIALIGAVAAAGSGARAQSKLNAFSLDASSWPKVGAQFFAFDAAKTPLRGLSRTDFIVTENGDTATVTDVWCPQPSSTYDGSVVFSFDVSGSMGAEAGASGKMAFALAQSAGLTLLQSLPLPTTRVAVQRCSDVSALLNDFTGDASIVRNNIQSMQPEGGNDFVHQLLDPRTGALSIAKTGTGRRVVVLFTDAWWTAMPDSVVRLCEDTCAKYGITFYAAVFTNAGAAPSGIKASLSALAAATGGQMFDGVVTPDDANAVALSLNREIAGEGPCTVIWRSAPGCVTTRNVRLSLRADTAARSLLGYDAPPTARTALRVAPNSVSLGFVPPPTSGDTFVTLTADHGPITVQTAAFSDPRFSAPLLRVPFTLAAGATLPVMVRYAPTDSSYVVCAVRFTANACNAETLYVSGGIRGVKPKVPQLRLVQPNGGEVFIANDSVDLVWTGALPSDTVRLEFSSDNGQSWEIVSDSATGLRYRWKLPNQASDICLARVSQLAANRDTVVIIPHGAFAGNWQMPVGRVLFSPDDSLLLVAVFTDSTRLWNGDDGTRWKSLAPASTSSDYLVPAAFSRNGRLALAGDPVRLFDTRTGAQLSSFDEGFEAEFNPGNQNLFLVSGYAGSMWDLSTGKNTHRLPVGGHGVYSPDGQLIAFPAELWNANSGALIGSFTGHTAPVYTTRVSPDGKQAVTASADSTARVWYAASRQIQWVLRGHRGAVMDAVFSPDGKSILTTSRDGTAKLWTSATGWLARSFGGPGLPVVPFATVFWNRSTSTSAKFRSDGAVIGAVVADSMLALWDANTGKLLRTVTDDTLISAFDLNAAGTRIATGNVRGVTKLWKLDAGPLQSDPSDKVWSIITPSASAIDVDFGNVLLGAARDSVVQAMIVNTSGVPLRVISLTIAGPNASEFLLASGTTPAIIPVGGTRTIELRFAPQSLSVRLATLVAVLSGDTVRAQLRGNGLLPQISVGAGIVDFGSVIIGGQKDSTVTAIIRNVGGSPVTFTVSKMRGPDLSHFAIDSGDAPFTIAAHAAQTIRLSFAPTQTGRVSGSLAFSFSGAGSPAVVQLFGTGVPVGPSLAAPSDLTFPALTCATTLAADSVTVSNQGGTALVISAVQLTGPDSKRFMFLGTLPDTIPAGESGSLPVRFAPDRAGSYSATLTIRSNAPGDSVHAIALSGSRDSAGFELLTNTIDLGLFCPGDSADTTVRIRNTGSAPLRVHAWTGFSGGAFSISPVDTTMDTGAVMTYHVHYSGAPADTAGTIVLSDPMCGTTQRCIVTARVGAPTLVADSVTVVTAVGAHVDTVITVANPSARGVTIDSVRIADPQFSLLGPPMPAALAAGASMQLRLRYQPTAPLPIVSPISLWGSPCDVTATTTISGMPSSASSVVRLPNLEALPGVQVTIPLFMTSAVNLDSAGARHFVATIRMKGRLLQPVDTDLAIVQDAAGMIRFTVAGLRSDTSMVLRTMVCNTAVADTDWTDLELLSFAWTDGLAQVSTIDGSFHLLNTCPGAGPIRVRFVGTPTLASITPNPAHGAVQVEYSLPDRGHVVIDVEDMLGRRAAVLVDADREAGAHQASCETSALPSGTYVCVLRSPGGISRRTLVISR